MEWTIRTELFQLKLALFAFDFYIRIKLHKFPRHWRFSCNMKVHWNQSNLDSSTEWNVFISLVYNSSAQQPINKETGNKLFYMFLFMNYFLYIIKNKIVWGTITIFHRVVVQLGVNIGMIMILFLLSTFPE